VIGSGGLAGAMMRGTWLCGGRVALHGVCCHRLIRQVARYSQLRGIRLDRSQRGRLIWLGTTFI